MGLEAGYLITISKGISEVCADEVESITNVSPEIGDNILRIKLDIDKLYRLIIWGRTIHKVIHILDENEFKDLDDIASRIANLDLKEFGLNGSFALRTSRYGSHDFTSLDANRVVGAAVYNALEKSGYNVHVDLNDPDVEYVLRIVGDKYTFGVNLVGESLHIRRYRVYNHPASIKTSLAAAMIYLSGFWEEPFIDPMAGGGTIPIEAALYRYRIAPGLFRDVHPLINLPYYDESIYFKVREDAYEQRVKEPLDIDIIYNDISTRYMKGAIRNAESAGVYEYIKFFSYDARELSKYIGDLVDGIAVFNPPYGIRMTRKEVLAELYDDVISELKILGIRKVIVITSEYRLLKNALLDNEFEIYKHLNVLHGKLTTHIVCSRL